ncbi:MAG: T9SS type A sorting domain-containing protein [Chitinophagales bacterium]
MKHRKKHKVTVFVILFLLIINTLSLKATYSDDLNTVQTNWNTLFPTNVVMDSWAEIGTIANDGDRTNAINALTNINTVYVTDGNPTMPSTITAASLSLAADSLLLEWNEMVDTLVAVGQTVVAIEWSFVDTGASFTSIAVCVADSIVFDPMISTAVLTAENMANLGQAQRASGGRTIYWLWGSTRGKIWWEVTCLASPPPLCSHECGGWMTLGEADCKCQEVAGGPNACKIEYGWGWRTPTGSLKIQWNPATLSFDVTITGLGSSGKGNGAIVDLCAVANPCSTWSNPSPDSAWEIINDIWGGAPQGTGTMYETTEFQLFASEAFALDNVVANNIYTFGACNGVGGTAWDLNFTIIAPSGNIDAFGLNENSICELTWTATESGTYTIAVNEAGNCGVPNSIDNGFPSITCVSDTNPCDNTLNIIVENTDMQCETATICATANGGTPPYTFNYTPFNCEEIYNDMNFNNEVVNLNYGDLNINAVINGGYFISPDGWANGGAMITLENGESIDVIIEAQNITVVTNGGEEMTTINVFENVMNINGNLIDIDNAMDMLLNEANNGISLNQYAASSDVLIAYMSLTATNIWADNAQAALCGNNASKSFWCHSASWTGGMAIYALMQAGCAPITAACVGATYVTIGGLAIPCVSLIAFCQGTAILSANACRAFFLDQWGNSDARNMMLAANTCVELPEGNYIFNVVDANNCTAESEVFFVEVETTSGNNTCVTCNDGVLNGDETDVDCGGSCEPCLETCGQTANLTTNIVYEPTLEATFSWNAVPNAEAYQLAGRKAGGNIKVFPETQNTHRTITSGILYDTSYEWSVRVKCDGSWTDYVLPPAAFTTDSAPFGKNINNSYDIFATESSLTVNLYPNPAQNKVNLQLTSATTEKMQVRLLDLTGKLLIEKNIDTGILQTQTFLDVSNLQNGYYLVAVNNGLETNISKLSIIR